MIVFGGSFDDFNRGWGTPPRPNKAKLHVEWCNGVGMVAYVGLKHLDDAEHKIPHMMDSMEGIISLAAKRGAMHA